MEAARDALREAVERDPENHVAQNDLAVLHCLFGDYAQALVHARRAVTIQPSLVVAYVNGAVAAGLLSGYDAALPWLDAALTIEPDDLSALLLRTSTLAKLNRGPEAVELGRRAVERHPESPLAHEILGFALQSAARYGEAQAEYDVALASGNNVTAGLRKVLMLLEQGLKQDALREIGVVLRENPALASAWYTRCLATDFEVGMLEIASMEELLHAPALTFNDRVQMHFALGRSHLSKGSDETAFSYLIEGNRLKRASIEYNVEADERSMRGLAASFAAELLNRGGEGNPSDIPVFVIGMPRSGTTLIEQILASHPAIFGAGELPLLGNAVAGLDARETDLLRAASEEYVATMASRAPKAARVVDKMPFNFLNVGFIRAMLPNARIIHCRRDPLDTCMSCYLALFDNRIPFAYEQTELGRYHLAYEELMRHWRSALPANRFLEVEYENVVANLESEARRMIEFCDLPWDERCLSFHNTKRTVLTASMNQVRRPIYSTSVGRSRQFLPYLEPLVKALGL